jgi:hypothetical protein
MKHKSIQKTIFPPKIGTPKQGVTLQEMLRSWTNIDVQRLESIQRIKAFQV